MRREDRQMPKEEAMDALSRAKWGVLSTCAGDTPYGVPVNYVFCREESALFFHCAPEGRKLDMIKSNGSVSFAAVTQERIMPDKLTTHYESVIVSGKASVVEGSKEKTKRLRQLCKALAPGPAGGVSFTDDCVAASLIVRIDIEEISGKRNP